ncbi:MAG: metallophosphoesterase [Clostridia bacterium]|nr:metallophosphoesterase [Clostridia bacterium]
MDKHNICRGFAIVALVIVIAVIAILASVFLSDKTTVEADHTHIYTSAVTEPTCTEQGYTTHVCACGNSYIDSYVDIAGEHSYTAGVCIWCGRNELGTDWLIPDFAEGDYTVVVIPDTQELVDKWPQTYYGLMQWIADHEETLNIQAVMHMGDMVNDNNDTQWTFCEAGTDILNASGIPWMPMRGNHDDSERFNQYYDYATYGSNQSWFGGSYHANKLDHTYWFFTVGEREYMVLSLGWAPDLNVLAWAQGVVESYPEKNVIINCHAYMNDDGSFLDPGDNWDVSTYLPGYPSGDDVWEAFKDYKNVVLAMGGHIHSPDVITRVDQNGDGRDVTSLLFDRQNDDISNHYGMIALLTFHSDSNTVDVNWYSTRYDALYRTKNQFAVHVPHLCDHVLETAVAEVTCTESGGVVHYCTFCEYSSLEETIPAPGHNYDTIVTAPTCTEKGYSTNICSVCGHSELQMTTMDVTDQFIWTDGKMIIATTGEFTNYTTWCASDYVDISGYTSLEILTANTASTGTTTGFAFYDANKNYVSGIKHTDGSGVYGVLVHNIEIPENAVYIRTTWYSQSHPNYDSSFGDFYCIGTTVNYINATGHSFDGLNCTVCGAECP